MSTIVLVHGAFADASSWNGVVERLQKQGHTVVAPANPLRGLADDTAYIASVVDQIEGPVVLVGHSYAGAIISNVVARARNVVGLVFVAAFAPDDGEWLGDVTARSKDAILGPALLQRKYPIGTHGETGVEFVVNPARFHDVFAADLPPDRAAVLAATQRPISERAFSDKAGPPAWKSVQSWAVVATGDKAAGADLVRTMAQRAGAKIVEVKGSHLVMLSQPDAVTEVILEAAHARAVR
ncbi:MAG TPA: alpha/beta hydrolase [Candidatus Limnocylindrales bacterium]|nr:alpha/beta hydrolase [Candidatus Limnocylindrales bacterium]